VLGGNVGAYKAYFLNDLSEITSSENIPGASDDEAVTNARALLPAQGHCGDFEVWEGARPIRILPRDRDGHLIYVGP
jgi:hypothetical protein